MKNHAKLSDRTLARRAIKQLVKEAGYLAIRSPYEDCQSCGHSAAHAAWHKQHPRSKKPPRYVFWHDQDARAFDGNGNITGSCPLFLRWSGDGGEIVEAFRELGLRTFWTGEADHAIQVLGRIGR